MNYTFELKELQATHIVYLHHQGDISLIPSSIRKLMQWAGPKGLINGPANKLISVYQHEGKELSVDIGLTVPQEVEGENEISKGLLSGGLYAIGHFEIGTDEIPAAWSLMYTLTSKHQCKPCAGKSFEIYQSIPLDQHPQDKCMIDLCIPVQMIDLKLIEEKAISILTECDKTIQFQLNPKAGVCFMKGGDSIVLTGKVEIVSDMEIKKALWSDWMFAHFPGGVIDPSYCILKFTSEEATYWIDNEFVKASI